MIRSEHRLKKSAMGHRSPSPFLFFCIPLILFSQLLCETISPNQSMAPIPAGIFCYPFRSKGLRDSIYLNAFELDKRPVTVEQFSNFLIQHPEYSKSKIKSVFADSQYLASWSQDPKTTREKSEAITEVTWYVAKAYCEEQGKHLPSTAEGSTLLVQSQQAVTLPPILLQF